MNSTILIKLSVILLVVAIAYSQQACDHPVYCQGDILKAIAGAEIYEDGKNFVDMPLKYTPDIVNQHFNSISNKSDNNELRQFILENFYNAHSEVDNANPVDWIENPSFLNNISDPIIKQFSFGIHQIWKQLLRKFDQSWLCNGCYSSITSPNPFVVAGGRFQEQYYWDNLWIVKGLLVSEMFQTAIYVGYNIIENIKKFGYMPNGGRIYYLNRSQPPMASIILNEIYQHLKDNTQYKQQVTSLLNYSYPYLKQEYQFFQQYRSINVTLPNSGGAQIQLNHYDCSLRTPRPESYESDYQLHLNNPDRNEQELYRNLGAAAESGWDFSTRWFQNKSSFGSINVTNLLAIDLNTILHKNEKILSQFASILGFPADSTYFQAQANTRFQAFQQLFYNNKTKQWSDFMLQENKVQDDYYPSNFAPLWSIANNLTQDVVNSILDILEQKSSLYPGGLPSSEYQNSNQQWDFPNVWAPSQSIIIEGLWSLQGNDRAQKLALKLSTQYLDNAYCTSNNSAKTSSDEILMYEKYDCLQVGKPGGSGEYEVQTGFGWSNGLFLLLMKQYGNQYQVPTCPSYQQSSTSVL